MQPERARGRFRQDVLMDYDGFLAKGQKPPKTTDDCYTPEPVFQAVKTWVYQEYGQQVEGLEVFRPFQPGGDYEREDYTGRFVLDNPPFSILSQILQHFHQWEVPFFLFAPTLTLFSARSFRDGHCTAIIQAANVIYENGADIPTSFLTNLDKKNRARVSHTLTEMLAEAQKQPAKKAKPKLVYPRELWSAAKLQALAKTADIDIQSEDCLHSEGLLQGTGDGARVFGGGLIVTPAVADKLHAAKDAASGVVSRDVGDEVVREVRLSAAAVTWLEGKRSGTM